MLHHQSRRESDDQVAVLVGRFEQILRAGDSLAAERLTGEALDAGLAPEVIQSLIIAPAMVRVGDAGSEVRWESPTNISPPPSVSIA